MGDDVLEFGVLGPVEVRADGLVAVGAPRVRAVLALLLIRPNELVSVDRFVDELWPDDPPDDARALVHGYLSRLRTALRRGAGPAAAERLVTRRPGYLLRVEADELDLARFERLVASARSTDSAQGLKPLREAEALWRGSPYADVPATPSIAAEVNRLNELRLAALETLYDCALAVGQDAAVVPELTELVNAYPLRERPVGQLMLALHRAGRTGDALSVYQQATRRLADELGIDPGPELRRVHALVLRGREAEADGDAPPAQLPPAVPGFAGRSAELARLDSVLEGAVVISALSGTAGVGKTALAVHWAHRVAGRFPDGQLYVNLRGYDPSGSPMEPAEAVRGFLDALGVSPRQVPPELSAQVGRYRSLVAGKRLLILLDNARNADQVRPLLPGSSRCLTVVTSRNQLTGLVAAQGAHPVRLDVLSDEEARAMLTHRLGTDRVRAEPDAVRQIIALTAGLPLALAIVAARAVTHPELRLEALTSELLLARGGLDAFAADDPATDLRAVFSWSYEAQSPAAARVFRLLGVHPGADVSVPAMASLAGVSVPVARDLLAKLASAHLVTQHVAGRFTCHDLLRSYATELAEATDSAEERAEALHRLLDHCLHTAYAAARLISPHRDPIALAPPRVGTAITPLSDHAEALAWLTAEHEVLVAAIHRASQAGFDTHVGRLAWTLVNFFDRRGHWQDLIVIQRVAVDVARRLGDSSWEARAHHDLARAYIQLGDLDETRILLERAIALWHEAGAAAGEAHALLALGQVLEQQGLYADAASEVRRALELYERIGHRFGQANTLNALGWLHVHLGEYRSAVAACESALALQADAGHWAGAGATWDTLGFAHHHLGEFDRATDCYLRAVQLQRELGDRHSEAVVLGHLGDNHASAADLAAARENWQLALTIYDELGHADAAGLRVKLGLV